MRSAPPASASSTRRSSFTLMASRRRATVTGAASIESNGQFGLNQRWVWGWDALLISDKTFYQDYHIQIVYERRAQSVPEQQTGRRFATLPDRSRQPLLFRCAHRSTITASPNSISQKQLPIIHPGHRLQLCRRQARAWRRTEFSFQPDKPVPRQPPIFDPINPKASRTWLLRFQLADPAFKNTNNCLLRGAPGNYTRGSSRSELEEIDH